MDQEEGLPAAVQKSPYHPAVIPSTSMIHGDNCERRLIAVLGGAPSPDAPIFQTAFAEKASMRSATARASHGTNWSATTSRRYFFGTIASMNYHLLGCREGSCGTPAPVYAKKGFLNFLRQF
jgi:hypothetical protein